MPKEIADYLNKMGARIPNIKPGKATIEYLTKVQASTRFWGIILSFFPYFKLHYLCESLLRSSSLTILWQLSCRGFIAKCFGYYIHHSRSLFTPY